MCVSSCTANNSNQKAKTNILQRVKSFIQINCKVIKEDGKVVLQNMSRGNYRQRWNIFKLSSTLEVALSWYFSFNLALARLMRVVHMEFCMVLIWKALCRKFLPGGGTFITIL